MRNIPPPTINRPMALEEAEYEEMTDENLLQCLQETLLTRNHLMLYQKACDTRLTRIMNASMRKKTRETQRYKNIAKAAIKALKKQKIAGEVSRSSFYLIYQ
jgi:hypothetical protein